MIIYSSPLQRGGRRGCRCIGNDLMIQSPCWPSILSIRPVLCCFLHRGIWTAGTISGHLSFPITGIIWIIQWRRKMMDSSFPCWPYLMWFPSVITVDVAQFIIAFCFISISRGIARAGEPNNLVSNSIKENSITNSYLDPDVHATLRRKQRRLVRDHPGVVVAVAKGAKQAISECKHQFKNRRWNCPTKDFHRGRNLFGKIVDRGTSPTVSFSLLSKEFN